MLALVARVSILFSVRYFPLGPISMVVKIGDNVLA